VLLAVKVFLEFLGSDKTNKKAPNSCPVLLIVYSF